jgi:hypothetical protein
MMRGVIRGSAAAAVASFAVGLLVLAVAYAVVAAVRGAYLLVVAPAVGLAIAVGVWSLCRMCTTGSRYAGPTALDGIVLLLVVAVLGISFGGALLVVPAAALMTAWMAARLSNGSNQGAAYRFQAGNARFINGCWYNVSGLNTYGIIIQQESSGASHTIYGHNDDSPSDTDCANFFAL